MKGIQTLTSQQINPELTRSSSGLRSGLFLTAAILEFKCMCTKKGGLCAEICASESEFEWFIFVLKLLHLNYSVK